LTHEGFGFAVVAVAVAVVARLAHGAAELVALGDGEAQPVAVLAGQGAAERR
jgi:hypothetical protein